MAARKTTSPANGNGSPFGAASTPRSSSSRAGFWAKTVLILSALVALYQWADSVKVGSCIPLPSRS